MAENYLELYQKALIGLKTGGKTLEASLQEIEEGKRQAIAGGQQALVSGGLSGTTMAAGVPIQAEKIAGRQRLGARGRAEQTYLTTLASFAAFAQRGEEAQKQREFETRQAQTAYARQAYQTRLSREYGAEQAGAQREFESEQTRLGREYVQQFPSIYDQGEIGTAPDLLGGGGFGGGFGGGDGADTPWPTAAPLSKEREELGLTQYPGYTPQTGDYMSVEGGAGGPILGGGATTSFGGTMQPSTQSSVGKYAPRTPRESIAAIRAGYYGKQGQQLKPYTRADAERLGFA